MSSLHNDLMLMPTAVASITTLIVIYFLRTTAILTVVPRITKQVLVFLLLAIFLAILPASIWLLCQILNIDYGLSVYFEQLIISFVCIGVWLLTWRFWKFVFKFNKHFYHKYLQFYNQFDKEFSHNIVSRKKNIMLRRPASLIAHMPHSIQQVAKEARQRMRGAPKDLK